MKILEILNPHAAGIDVGSEWLHVSIAGGTPKVFTTMTPQVQALRDWLKAEGVTTVALEATGVYWLYLHDVLEAAGIKVVMVNGRSVRNVPGRKTDMKDCQWLATLHVHGLLKAGFVPPATVRQLQDYQRLRADHISMAASHVQHMQKALDRMNLKVHEVISSVVGASGLRFLRTVVSGERDSARLLECFDEQILGRKRARLTEALQGVWSPTQLFALRQALAAWDNYQGLIAEVDQEIEGVLKALAAATPLNPPPATSSPDCPPTTPIPPKKSAKRTGRHGLAFQNISEIVRRICGGHDATQVPGFTDSLVCNIIGEVGVDMSCWPTEKHFTAWLGLAPGSNQSGKRKGSEKRHRNRAGRLFSFAARSLARSVDKALGGFYRRIRARRGGLIANQALSRKLACLFYQVLRYGMDYVECGLKAYEEQQIKAQEKALQKLASRHGYTLTPKNA